MNVKETSKKAIQMTKKASYVKKHIKSNQNKLINSLNRKAIL